jgi:DNA-binding GntR family transcriptional regulator
LKAKNMEGYRIYNRDFHSAVIRAAKNSYLSSAIEQVALQSEMLTSKTIRIVGRPLRAIEEHQHLIELIEQGQENKAEKLMGSHIMSALEDIIRYHLASGDTSEPEKKASKRVRSA